MGEARFIGCGEILQRDFAKSFLMQRFVPILAVNGERLVVMALEKQGVGEVALDEDQVVAVTSLDPVASSRPINERDEFCPTHWRYCLRTDRASHRRLCKNDWLSSRRVVALAPWKKQCMTWLW